MDDMPLGAKWLIWIVIVLIIMMVWKMWELASSLLDLLEARIEAEKAKADADRLEAERRANEAR